MNVRAVYRISLVRALTRAGGSGPLAWHEGRGARLEGSFRADEVVASFPAGPVEAQAAGVGPGAAWPGRAAGLDGLSESSVDGAGPGRQASGTRPPARDRATAEAPCRSTPAATARDSRWPPGHPRPPRTITRPGAPGGRVGRCLPRQTGRTVTRQVARQPRPAGVPAAPGGAVGAGQRRNVPSGVIRD